MKIDKIEILSRTNFFDTISKTSLNALADICLLKNIEKKKHLFYEGERGLSIYILVSGSIQLYKNSSDGKEIVIKVVKPGELFGEVILFEQDKYPVSAIALKSSVLFQIYGNQFTLLLKHDDFCRDFFGSLMKKMRYLTERIKYITSADVEERFISFLEEHYGRGEKIVPNISKKDIAASIGTTPETFSRLLNK